MIVGVGIDVVDISRFAESLGRTPDLRDRLFTPGETGLGIASLAARFAAKEAIAKALGAPGNLHWHDGTVLARANDLGVTSCHLSLSHDAGIASAVVVLEGG
jgi:holo-[acyl-carrier protein] synthase